MSQVSESLARPVRTGIQALPAGAITEFIDAFIFDMSDRQYGALIVLLTLIFGWAQVAFENARGQGLWFRKVPPTESPVEGG